MTDLRDCLFKNDQFFGDTARTTLPGDTAKVSILPRTLGELIAESDIAEDFFHVELLSDRAEIWTIFEWRESNSRRQRIKETLDTARAKLDQEIFLKQQELALLNEIADELEIARLPKAYCQMWARILYQNKDKNIAPFLQALEQLNVDIRPILDKVNGKI